MVQVTDTRITQKKMNAVRVSVGKAKTPAKDTGKVSLQYASLPGRFKVQPRGSSLLLAQTRKGGNNSNGRCIPGISKTPPKRRIRKLTSSVKLGTSKLYYSLRLRNDGVDALIHQGGQLFRVPLDVKTSWDAKKRKVIIGGRVLKSSRLINTPSGLRLHFDRKELAKLVKPQMDALVYEINNRIRSGGLFGVEGVLKTIDGNLAILKKRMGRGFKKHAGVRAMRKFLLKHHELLKAHLLKLIEQRRKIARLRRRKGFTRSFRKKLKSLKRQNAKLKGRLVALKAKVWKIIYKYWLRDRTVRKRPCP